PAARRMVRPGGRLEVLVHQQNCDGWGSYAVAQHTGLRASSSETTREKDVPTGKVKWFDAEKGFGFVTGDDGQEVYLHKSVLPSGVETVKTGTRLEYGIADGRRGKQALSARVLGEQPSVARASRKPAEEMGELVQDLVNMLDNTTGQLRNGRYPKPEQS